MKKVYGILGFPLSHSFSNRYFTAKFEKEALKDCVHKIFPLQDLEKFPELLKSENSLIGLNVTIPHKVSILPFLDELDETAKAVGAVNTIKISRDASGKVQKCIGYNTDVFGFGNALKPFLKNNHQRALILGTGGAAKAVAHVLKQLGIDFYFVSRTKEKYADANIPVFCYQELNQNHIQFFHLIVNCSPAGMYPNVDESPEIPYHFLDSNHLLFDLIYNPEETEFIRKGKLQGALTQNGLTMFYLQAEESWRIWGS
jgi:shikimate dehydrogenase